MRLILLVLLTSIVIFGCTDKSTDPESSWKGDQYAIKNNSDFKFGIRIYFNTENLADTAAISVMEKKFIIHPQETVTFFKSEFTISVDNLMEKICLRDTMYYVDYKIFETPEFEIVNKVNLMELNLPSLTSAPLSYKTSSNILCETNSYYGIAHQLDHPNGESMDYFFSTSNFEDIDLVRLPSEYFYWKIVYKQDHDIIINSGAGGSSSNVKYRSTNNGASWSYLYSNPSGFGYYNVGSFFLDRQTGWDFVYYDWEKTKIYYNGSNLISTLEGYCVKDSYFWNEKEGILLTNSSDNVSPSTAQDAYLFRTEDGGHTWSEPVCISSEYSARKLFVLDSETYIVKFGSMNGIKGYYRTADSGQTWQEIHPSHDKTISDLYFLDANVGYSKIHNQSYYNYNGHIYKTTDGGLTWYQTSEEEVLGSFIHFSDEQHGVVYTYLSSKGTAAYTTNDGGVTWQEALFPYPYGGNSK